MAKIKILELKEDTDDIWAVIEMKSEKANLNVEFQLECLLKDWDVQKMSSYTYLNSIMRWKHIAERNNFEFEDKISAQPEFYTL